MPKMKYSLSWVSTTPTVCSLRFHTVRVLAAFVRGRRIHVNPQNFTTNFTIILVLFGQFSRTFRWLRNDDGDIIFPKNRVRSDENCLLK